MTYILIVEDQPMVRKLLESYVEKSRRLRWPRRSRARISPRSSAASSRSI